MYHIFCEKHVPLKLKRTLETRENQAKGEIERFFKGIEKYYTAFLMEPTKFELIPDSSLSQQQEENKLLIKKNKKRYQRDDSDHFMNLIDKYRKKQMKKPSTITLQKIASENSCQHYEIIEIETPKNPNQKYKKLHINDDIWVQMPYKGLTPYEKYKKYKRILVKVLQTKERIINNICRRIKKI